MKNDVKRKIGTRRHLRAMYVERDDAVAAIPTKPEFHRRDAERAEILI